MFKFRFVKYFVALKIANYCNMILKFLLVKGFVVLKVAANYCNIMLKFRFSDYWRIVKWIDWILVFKMFQVFKSFKLYKLVKVFGSVKVFKLVKVLKSVKEDFFMSYI